MKAILDISMRFLRYDPQMTLQMTLRLTLRSPSQTTLQTGPEMASDTHIPDLRRRSLRIRVFLRFY